MTRATHDNAGIAANTDVSYYPDETFTVQNGGFNTPTASRRVTQFTPDDYYFWHSNKQLTTFIDRKPTHVEDMRLPVNKE